MIRSVLSNWVAMVVTGLLGFILTPILIRGLGDFQYGMWVLVAAALEQYGLLDMGIRGTLQRFVARYEGARDRQALDRTFASALAVSLGVCLLAALLSFALARVLPGFFQLSGRGAPLFSQLVILLGLSVAVTFPTQVIGAYLCGLLRYDLFNLAAISSAILRFGLFLAALRLGYGARGVALATLGVSLFTWALHWFLARWADPQFGIRWRLANWTTTRELFGYSVYVFLTQLGDFFRFRVDSVVIARVLTMGLVTPFNVAARLVEYFKQVLYAVMGPLMPAMSSLDGQAREGDLRRLFLRATRITALLSLFIGLVLVLNGRTLLRLWVGERFVATYPILLTLVVGYIIALGQAPGVSVLYARAEHKALGWWTAGEGVVNLALSIYWARRYGILGVALGTAVPMLFTKLVLQPWFVLRTLRLSAREYVLEALARPILASALFLVVVKLGAGILPVSRWPAFMLSGAAQTALFALLAWTIGITSADRRLVGERVRQMALTWSGPEGKVAASSH